ncbi:hypothetical protein NEOC84_000633|nr:hypothetical protein [Neochlamydia sp. AcF84]
MFFRQLSKLKLTYRFITTKSFSLFLQITRLGEQPFLTGVKRHDKLPPWRHELLTPTPGRRHQQLTPSHSKI